MTGQSFVSDERQLQMLYEIQQATVLRTKMVFSIVFIQFHKPPSPHATTEETYEALYKYVSSQSRNSDRVFRHFSMKFVIVLLPFCGEIEAQAYFKRLVKLVPNVFHEDVAPSISFIATSNEIANAQFELVDIIDHNTTFFHLLEQPIANHCYRIETYAIPETELIKVSILENNLISQSILKNAIQNIHIDFFELQLKTFDDGLQFIESNWYQSGHTHIVILNDILPFKNGIEVIQFLRSLPNNSKYIILLISKRTNEEAIIYAYNNGVDSYFTKPFNIRLVEAEMQNILRRLRS